MSSPHIVLLDNHDSFVYNLVDALAGFDTTVFRNTVAVHDVLRAQPDIIVLSPGPGHPRDAGCMMELIDATLGTIPILGVCLGFQALLEHHGGAVEPCGPVHGKSVPMTLTEAGVTHPVFQDLATDTEPDQPTGSPRYASSGGALSLPWMRGPPSGDALSRAYVHGHRRGSHGGRNG